VFDLTALVAALTDAGEREVRPLVRDVQAFDRRLRAGSYEELAHAEAAARPARRERGGRGRGGVTTEPNAREETP
jgi:hypothetical protein